MVDAGDVVPEVFKKANQREKGPIAEAKDAICEAIVEGRGKAASVDSV